MKWPQQQQQQHGQQQLLTTGAAVLPAFLEHKIRRQRQPEEVEATSIRLMNRSNRSDRLSRRRIGSKRIINAKTNALERQRRMRKANEEQQQQHQQHQQQQQQQQQSGAATGNNSPRNKHAAPAAAPFLQRIPEFLIIALVAPKKKTSKKTTAGEQWEPEEDAAQSKSISVQSIAAVAKQQRPAKNRAPTGGVGGDRRPATADNLSPSVRLSICPMS
ncbi:hypothetical protein ACLKA6_011591 [Drosophila palustris]